MNIANKRVVITGGSEGIGFACARSLAEKGAVIYLISRDIKKLELAQQKLEPHKCGIVSADISDWNSIFAAITLICERIGGIDILIHCAGISLKAAYCFSDTPLEEFNQIEHININGTFHVCKAVVPIMKEQHSGYIIILSSLTAHKSHAGYMAYCASKFAKRAMAESLADECKGSGIRVSTISPGKVATTLWSYKNEPPDDFAFSKMLRADDIARTIAFLLELPDDVYIDDIRIQKST